METYSAIINYLEQNNLLSAANALRKEMKSANKQGNQIPDPKQALQLQSMINKAIETQQQNEVRNKIKQSHFPTGSKPFKTLSPEETEGIMEGFLNKLVNDPNLLEDERLNAKVEKLFDNPSFQRMVEQMDVAQDMSNLSFAHSFMQKNIPTDFRTEPQVSANNIDPNQWEDDVPRFGGSAQDDELFAGNDVAPGDRISENKPMQQLQVSQNNEPANPENDSNIKLERSPSIDEIFSSDKPEQSSKIQDSKDKSQDRSGFEKDVGKMPSMIQHQSRDDTSLFLNKSQSFVISALEDQQNIIDEYDGDDDPGFDLYEVGERDFPKVSQKLAEKYGFPMRAVAIDKNKKDGADEKDKKNNSGNGFTPSNGSDILKDLKAGEKDSQKNDPEDKGYIHIPSHLKHPPSNDSFYPVKFDNVIYDCFNLKVIYDRERTGFEETKDFPIVINSVIAGRYQILQYLGSAAFSKAIEVEDIVTKQRLCMKIIENNKDYYDQSIDEIKLLKFINYNGDADDKNFIKFYDYFYHKEHLFILTELLKENLYEFYKLTKETDPEPYFTIPRIQKITRQVLLALDYIHGLHLIHCDLKPENILMKDYENADIKVIDFGSSCFVHDHLSSYVQSRSYRAPEVIIGCKYDYKIDMWSLGCILAELYTGDVLFQNDTVQGLLARVIGIVGPFPEKMMKEGRLVSNFFTREKLLYQEAMEDDSQAIGDSHDQSRRKAKTGKIQILVPKRSSLRHRLKTNDPYFLDFVRSLLELDPSKRPSAREALNHPFLTEAKYQDIPYKRRK